MSYYFAKTIDQSFEDTIELVRLALKAEGFGIISDIDIQATMKNKLDKDMPKYRILGACNPVFAWEALQAENKIGTMLPCNVIVRETDTGTEVAAVDPVASMQAIDNPNLGETALMVRDKLSKAVASL